MGEKLFEVVKDNWLRYRSIPVAFLLLGAMYINIMNSVNTWKSFCLELSHYIYFSVPFVALFVAYIIACCMQNRLPKAPNGTLAVLFVIDAENSTLFKSVEYKLVHQFQQLFINDEAIRFAAICVSSSQVKTYQLQDHRSVIDLLLRTNCIFLVNVCYMADDVNTAENFELTINYGVAHPKLSADAKSILSRDLTNLGAPVSKRQFARNQIIDVFSFTAQTLANACRYILGLVYLLSGNINDAYLLLKSTQNSLAMQSDKILGISNLKVLVNDRLFATCAQMASSFLDSFRKDHGYHYLEAMCRILEEANAIYPDTYFYNLNMAYAFIILRKDPQAAKLCVEKCKRSKQEKEWLYSDAFLSAYVGLAPATVLSRYKRAFEISYYNLVEIIDYIEFVLEKEPEKINLHLAAGLV